MTESTVNSSALSTSSNRVDDLTADAMYNNVSVQMSTDIGQNNAPTIPCDSNGFPYGDDMFTVAGIPTPEQQGDSTALPEPHEMPDGPYGRAAQAYWEAGWQPLPLPARKKFAPPTGFTGQTAYSKKLEADQVQQWSSDNRHGNIALRMPMRTAGFDVDDYAKGSVVKLGRETLLQLIDLYGPLPKTVMSTARPESIGQLLYRIPESAGIVILPGVLGPGIEAIQHHHRYTVAWPSTNPDADGAVYRFWLPDEEYEGVDFWNHRTVAEEGYVPRVDDLPELPEAWCNVTAIGKKKGRSDYARGASAAPAGSYEIQQLMNRWAQNGDRDPRLAEQIIEKYRSDYRAGDARHDSCMRALTWACKVGEAGLIDPQPVIDTLDSLFASDKPEASTYEFHSMLAWAAANGPLDAPAYLAKWEERNASWTGGSSLPDEAKNIWAGQEQGNNVVSIPDPRQAHVAVAETSADTSAPAPQPEGEEKDRIVFRRASEVRVRRTEWMWDTTKEGATPTSGGRIPRAMLTMAAGLPGTGKSQFAIWMTAQLTQGTLPGCHYGEPKNVIYAATEDDWDRTIAPRLIAAGADLDRVFHIAVKTVENRTVRLTVPEHVDELGSFVQDNDVALVVLDPLISHLGGSLKNPNAEKEVRDAAEPLVKAAARYGFTVLGLGHFNKDSKTSDPVERLMGSRGFSALLRALIVFAKDKDAEDEETTEQRFVVSQAKNNLGRTDMPSYSYTIASAVVPTEEGDAYVSRFVLGPETDTNVEKQMASANRSEEERDAQNDCKSWLRAYLTDQGGEASKADIEASGKKEGYSSSTMYRARKSLKLVVTTTGFGGAKTSLWSLPTS